MVLVLSASVALVACDKDKKSGATTEAPPAAAGGGKSCADAKGAARVAACHAEGDVAALEKAIDQECHFAGADTWTRNKAECQAACAKVVADEKLKGKPAAESCGVVVKKQ